MSIEIESTSKIQRYTIKINGQETAGTLSNTAGEHDEFAFAPNGNGDGDSEFLSYSANELRDIADMLDELNDD